MNFREIHATKAVHIPEHRLPWAPHLVPLGVASMDCLLLEEAPALLLMLRGYGFRVLGFKGVGFRV